MKTILPDAVNNVRKTDEHNSRRGEILNCEVRFFFFLVFYSSVLIPAPSYSHYVFFQVKRDVNEQPRPNFQDSGKTVNLSQVLLRHLEPSGHPS